MGYVNARNDVTDVLICVSHARAHCNRGGVVRQSKTGENVNVPEHSRLTEILDATPKVATVVVTTTSGQAYTSDGFRTNFQRLRKEMEAEGKIGTGQTFHGLRHTVAT